MSLGRPGIRVRVLEEEEEEAMVVEFLDFFLSFFRFEF